MALSYTTLTDLAGSEETPTGPDPRWIEAKAVQANLLGTFHVMTLAAEKIAATEALEHGQRGVVINAASVAA